MAAAVLESAAEETPFATCVDQDATESDIVFNKWSPWSYSNDSSPKTRGNLCTSVNQTNETKLITQTGGVNLQLVLIINTEVSDELCRTLTEAQLHITDPGPAPASATA